MNAINITDKNRKITITIKGEAYDTLQRLADAMNEWDTDLDGDVDNTPLSVFENFFTYELDLLEYPTTDTSENVVEGIETGTDDPTEERKRKDCLYDLMHQHDIPVFRYEYEKIKAKIAERVAGDSGMDKLLGYNYK